MMLPIIVTQYVPIAYVPGSLIAQLKNHLRNVEPNKDSDWPYGPVYDATKDFLTDYLEDWPIIEDDDNGQEPQDTENFEIISIDETGAIIACGGDWQEPMRVYITCDLTGQMRVWKAEFDKFPSSGLGDKDILNIIEQWQKK